MNKIVESILSKYSDDTVLAILHVFATLAMLIALAGFAAAYWAYFV